ncbi:MAG TPA: OmpA family protein [Longimicrobiales bacterium]|jgi:outer membrane protein OmpA-like peptidoglycan-associated protein
MSSRMITAAVTWVLVLASIGTASAQEGHPLIQAYAGSFLLSDPEVRAFDEQQIVVGPVRADGTVKTERLEGKVTRMDYQDPEDRSSLERIRNYQQALGAGAFEIVFTCGNEECGPEIDVPTVGYFPPERYLVARLARPEGDVWVAVYVGAGSRSRIHVVEVAPMETGMVAVTAEALGRDLLAAGHAAVYGVYFDTGSDDLTPESAQALAEIGRLLDGNPSLKLHVVGHTDNAGGLASNMDLSSRRAAAVVEELTTRYAVASDRLLASGVGPLAPVASNATEAGRAHNRRVELVVQ